MTSELPLIDRLRDVADLHHTREQVRPLVDAVVRDLSTDPLGTSQTSARLIALGEVLGSPRAEGSREARARVEDMLRAPGVELG